jgi:gliding motility associated protien GldN
MKYFVRILVFFVLVIFAGVVNAQPKARRVKEAREKNNMPSLSVRARTQFVNQINMPEQLVWKRDIYRSLNLKEESNSPLYYPSSPIGKRMNLFTYLFQLLLQHKISAYEYRLDGNELFVDENKLNVKEFMDKFRIYYEQKALSKQDTVLVVNNADVPSKEVLSVYVKESYFFDQRTSTFSSKIVALCPVMHRKDLFSSKAVKSPMFWVKYSDIAPYLMQMPIMASNYNNTSNLTIHDYFMSHLYKGDIYKTNNLLGQTLSQYCLTDSALHKEQEKIENELKSFDKSLWGEASSQLKEVEDSMSIKKEPKQVEVKKEKNSKRKGRTKKTTIKKDKKTITTKSSSRFSVRRRRR